VTRVGAVAAVVRASTPEVEAGYRLVAALHPAVRIEWQPRGRSDWLGRATFKASVERALAAFQSPFIAPLVDEMVWLRPVDLGDVAGALAALGDGVGTFQLQLGLHYANAAAARPQLWRPAGASGPGAAAAARLPPAVYCYTWTSLDMQPPDFMYTTIVDAGVYHARRLRHEWAALGEYHHPGELEGRWYARRPDYAPGCVHLLYENASVVNNELGDTVREDYGAAAAAASAGALANDTAALLAGWRVDVARFDGMTPPFSHVRAPPHLVPLVGRGSQCDVPDS